MLGDLPGEEVAGLTRDLLARIEPARTRMPAVFAQTPQFTSGALGTELGVEVTLKIETCNPIRSFKGRGCSALMSSLAAGSTVVAATAGNFGQGLAYAAASRRQRVVAFCPANVNALKQQQMLALGATVRTVDGDFDMAKVAAREFSEKHGHRFVEDGHDLEIAAGAGTIAVELLQAGSFDAILVPCGNGSLLTGIATWVGQASPGTAVVGVCASGAPAMAHAFHDVPASASSGINTVADGIAVRVPVPRAVALMREHVDDVVVVDDEVLLAAMRLCLVHAGLLVEPAGVAGVAALLAHDTWRGMRVAVPVCGSNVTAGDLRRWAII